MGKWLMGVVVALLGCLAWAGALRPQGVNEPPKIQGAIVGDRMAYVVLPPEVVCGPEVNWVRPSHSGSYVLVDRRVMPDPFATTPANAELNLTLWDATTRRSSVLWRESYPAPTPTGNNTDYLESSVVWLGEVPVALVVLRTRIPDDDEGIAGEGTPSPVRILLVTAGKRTARVLFNGTSKDQFLPNERQPVFAYQPYPGNTLQILNVEGKLVRNVTAPSARILWMTWMADGKTLLGLELPKQRKPQDDEADQPRRERVFYLLDTQTGEAVRKVNYSIPRSEEAPERPQPPYDLSYGKGQIQDLSEPKRPRALNPLWLVGNGKETHGNALVTVDGGQEWLTSNAVYYQSQGTLFAAPIVRLPIADYLAMERARTMQRAKQVGLGLMMYSQDYDEVLPPPGGNIAEVVAPYLRDNSLMGGFSPLYKNPNQAGLEKPAETAIGSLSGPGGQAIIYADGHVEWKPDKQP